MKLTLERQSGSPIRRNLLKNKGVGSLQESMASDTGLLILRLVVGGLLAGHGSQMLFGWFSGPGLKRTAGMVESMGFKPGSLWAAAASASEFGGGMLTATGLLHPLGPIGTLGSMYVAATRVHRGKPIWVTSGGAELPVINMAVALALTLTGPGRFSLDHLLGIRLPRPLVMAIALIEATLLILSIINSSAPASEATGKKPQPATTSTTSTMETQADAEHSRTSDRR